MPTPVRTIPSASSTSLAGETEVDPAELARALASLEPGALAERLMILAREARGNFAEDDQDALYRLARILSMAANEARHGARDLLEVAESFVRVLGGPNFGERDLAARAFMRRFGSDAEQLFANMLRRPLRQEEIERHPLQLREALVGLAKQGVLVREPNWAIVPAMVSSIRDMVSPPVFRMWHKVEAARRQAEGAHNPEDQLLLIASAVGVTLQQADRFLNTAALRRRTPRTGADRGQMFAGTDVTGQGTVPEQDSTRWGVVHETMEETSPLLGLDQRN